MTLLALLAAVLPTQAPATAAPAQVRNAVFRPHAPARGLAGELDALVSRSREPAWIGWTVPADREAAMCCFEHVRGVPRGGCCALEEREQARFVNGSPADQQAAPLEAVAEIRVLVRAEHGRVDRVRAYSPDCVLDFGGRPLHWLGDARPGESVATLSRLVGSQDLDADDALSTLAAHAGPEADAALEGFARRAAEREVRGQALFWMAQRAADKAAGAILRAAREDPDSEVRKQALFALSELPNGTGIPHLIEVARSHRDRELRRTAFFWLGESEDPRALDFIAEVLRR
jgi:hypothetical protein